MSVLEEPPEERQPIQTYVMEYNPESVREAINREVARGGQVYYLHNRVRNIVDVAARIQQLVPDAAVTFAHGQMSERELENVMMEFIEGEIDVLVCTTIIETGLDIPNVNTIIIQDSDHMGLSQLYQIRGRVGRSNRSSYAYLMYRKDKILTEASEKRLQTIREFTEFGAGFKIAMRDLEIRGAGNLLGAEQHGHMDTVGYDMYCKLLAEAVDELRGTPKEEGFETTIDINVDAFIPPFFIADELQKLEIYKRIAAINSDADYYDVQEEIEDRFGTLPAGVQNLLDAALLKTHANKIGVASIKQKGRNVVLSFIPTATADPLKIADAVRRRAGRLTFTVSPPTLVYKTGEDEDERFMAELREILKQF
jgi:transcription-repair coupling factor (superfamily II helicase)